MCTRLLLHGCEKFQRTYEKTGTLATKQNFSRTNHTALLKGSSIFLRSIKSARDGTRGWSLIHSRVDNEPLELRCHPRVDCLQATDACIAGGYECLRSTCRVGARGAGAKSRECFGNCSTGLLASTKSPKPFEEGSRL